MALTDRTLPVNAAGDEVELASRDSFPASDPPSWTPVAGVVCVPSGAGAAPEEHRERVPEPGVSTDAAAPLRHVRAH